MTTPHTAVHASGARRRPSTRVAGTRRKRPVRRAQTRRRTVTKGNRRKRRTPQKRVVTKDLQRWWPALLIAVAVLAGLAWDTEYSEAAPPIAPAPAVPAGHCTVAGTDVTLTVEMYTNARTIAQVAVDRGLPPRAVAIALATAQQESRLRNLDYGDRDSLGLFQQRPSAGWGTPAQVQDPVYAANKFYDGLVKVPGWETGRLTEVAQSVQLSAFPNAYEQWTNMAFAWTNAILSGNPDRITCTPG
jgi:hypothetical protein